MQVQYCRVGVPIGEDPLPPRHLNIPYKEGLSSFRCSVIGAHLFGARGLAAVSLSGDSGKDSGAVSVIGSAPGSCDRNGIETAIQIRQVDGVKELPIVADRRVGAFPRGRHLDYELNST